MTRSCSGSSSGEAELLSDDEVPMSKSCNKSPGLSSFFLNPASNSKSLPKQKKRKTSCGFAFGDIEAVSDDDDFESSRRHKKHKSSKKKKKSKKHKKEKKQKHKNKQKHKKIDDNSEVVDLSCSPARPSARALTESPAAAAESLKKELVCPLCFAGFFKPVTLSCGHSLCRVCLGSLLVKGITNDTDETNCPTCRETICLDCAKGFKVNFILHSISLQVSNNDHQYGEAEEDKKFRQLYRTINDGDAPSSSDRQIADSIDLFRDCVMRRHSIMDPNDSRFCISLALDSSNVIVPEAIYGGCTVKKSWYVEVLVLELEEDELDDHDNGFPFLVDNSVDDTIPLRNTFSGNFECKTRCRDADSNAWGEPHITRATARNGRLKMKVKVVSESEPWQEIQYEIISEDFPLLRFSVECKIQIRPREIEYNRAAFRYNGVNGVSNSRGVDSSDSDDEEEESEDGNEYEKDSFCASENSSIEMESDASSRDSGSSSEAEFSD